MFYANQGLAFAQKLNYPLGIGLMHGQIGAFDIGIGKMEQAKSLNLHQETAEQKNIELINNTPAEVMIYADSSHIEFVIRNLIANAVKYTNKDGWVKIEAAIYSPKGYTTTAIKDNGIGVDKNLQDKIFEPGNESMAGTDSEKGNSIGLSFAKSL